MTDPLTRQEAAATRWHAGHDGAAASEEPGGVDEFDMPAAVVRSASDAEADDGVDSAADDVAGAEADDGVDSAADDVAGAEADDGVDSAADDVAGAEADDGVDDVAAVEADDGVDAGAEAGDADDVVNTEAVNDGPRPGTGATTGGEHPDASLAAERLSDLQRLQAEYVNYKKRVDRDRAVAREMGISQVLESLLPVLDDIHLAREHGDLEAGPFAAIAEKLEAILSRFGVERFGAVGEQFDPMVHEALMHVEADLDESATMTTVVQILQPGYRTRDRLVRPARVSVADPK